MSRLAITILFVLGLLILSGCKIITIGEPQQPPSRDTANVSEQDVRLMIARFGPLIYLRNDEKYVMDDPEYILDHGVSLSWGRVDNSHSYDAFSLTGVQSRPTSSDTLLDDARAVRDLIRSLPDANKYKYWLSIDDAWKAGNLSRAKSLVRVLPHGKYSTELQFWLFYPFNGPGRVEICASSKACDDNWLSQTGRHYGDWELVSIVVSNTATQLLSVYMSRHSGGETFHRWEDGTYRSTSRPENRLSIFVPAFKDMYRKHPIVFSAVSSHAHYPSVGNHNYERVFSKGYLLGTASADLFDRTDDGLAFRTYDPNRYWIISSDLPSFRVTEPKWLAFDGRWGQYEKLADRIKFGVVPTYTYKEIGSGPTGPKMKSEWASAFH
jgi:hypothetical protein